MNIRGKRNSDGSSVSASELAQMGRCERLVVFEHLCGCRRTESQHLDRKRGLLAHEQFEREGLDAMAALAQWPARRTVGSCDSGDALRFQDLRQTRVGVERPVPAGCWLIKLCCRVAPGTCAVPPRWPVFAKSVRLALGAIAAGLRRLLG